MPHAPFRAVVLAALALAACKGPAVPNPLVGQTRYTCCNMHYERPKIDDTNYQKGALIPFGTAVQIVEVRKNTVTFQPVGHPEITLVQRWSRKTQSMDEFMSRVFVADDPHSRLRPSAAPTSGKKKDKRAGAERDGKSDSVRRLIEQGAVEEGMTREQVLMSLGYPPVHRTPSLDTPAWTYWENRWVTFVVHFEGDKVSRVER
jgi:hypothetical protein